MIEKLLLGLSMVFLTTVAWAQPVEEIQPGKLGVEGLGVSACPGKTAVRQGQQARLTGSGFLPGGAVRLQFWCCDGHYSSLGSVTADGSGGLDATITLPQGFAVPTYGALQADGPASSGVRWLTADPLVGASTTSDGDGDGFADFCDNCPSISNPGQGDADTDGLGDVCDSCPFDIENDSDGDGLCGNVDACPFDAQNDIDGDQWCGNEDNCPTVDNFFQEDSDKNGIGDACQMDPTCSDGIDNDRDGRVDFPLDAGCSAATDTTETDPSIPCDDGIDNDGDARADFHPNGSRDLGCSWATGSAAPENPECDDGIDNDGDGLIDWNGDFGRSAPDPECQGFGFGTSEAVPEPGVLLGLAAGVLLLSAMGRSRRRHRRL